MDGDTGDVKQIQVAPMGQQAPPMGMSAFSQEFKYVGVPQTEILPAMSSYPPAPMLQAEIKDRPAFSHVEVTLGPEQKVKGNGAAMLWMDFPDDGQNLASKVRTHCAGGCCQSCYRGCAGESVCQNTFGPGPGRVTFGFKLPGDMLPFGVMPGEGWIVAPGAFVAGTENIDVSARFAGCFACCCGGVQRPWVVRITVAEGNANPGVFWAGGYGALTRHELAAGQTLYVDTGLFFAASDKTTIDAGCVGGLITCLCGGEGIVMKFKGPNIIYTQNRNPRIWQKVLHPRHRKRRGAQGGQGGGQIGGGVGGGGAGGGN